MQRRGFEGRLSSESTTGADLIRPSRYKLCGHRNTRAAANEFDRRARPCVGARRTAPQRVSAYLHGEYRRARAYRPCRPHRAVADIARLFDPARPIGSDVCIVRNPPLKRQAFTCGGKIHNRTVSIGGWNCRTGPFL